MIKKLLFTGLILFSYVHGQYEQIYSGVGSKDAEGLKRVYLVYCRDKEKTGTITQYMLDNEVPLYKDFPLLQAVYQADFELLKELIEVKKLPIDTLDAFFAATVSLTIEYVFNEDGKHVDNKFIKFFADHGLKVDDYFSTRASQIITDETTGSESLFFMDATGQYCVPIKKVAF